MPENSHRLEAIITRALTLPSGERRSAFVREECGDDFELRAQVESLLESPTDREQILAVTRHDESQSAILERPGTIIGPYKLMEQVGEGGMGVVYVAQQRTPVTRRVALKIIKPGMDSREVIARFSAERQALAMMDHPNIAKVLDANATESGRPYFVMELVKGVAITQYCDQHRLSARARLELFVDVCHAIQHAHLKGVIHRDVKPNNVLVASHDGNPVVKVIDFGVAKAVNQQLTEQTVYTRLTQLIGTPLYMSPEQAGMSSLDVDTRTDIYSLGVLLYELLTGQTPFDRARLHSAAVDEIQRIIREEEPPRPSTRISTLGEAATSICQSRDTDAKNLQQRLRGDLDWIVMKAIEKDRTRRYETANAFAADIERHLRQEPILARPPSSLYRLQKFVRRNRAAVVTAALLAFALLIGIVGTTAGMIWALDEKENAETARQSELAALQTAEENASDARRQAGRAEHHLQLSLQTIDRLLNQVAIALEPVPRMAPLRRQLLEDALALQQEILQYEQDNPLVRLETAKAHHRVGEILLLLGELDACVISANAAVAVASSISAENAESAEIAATQANAYLLLCRVQREKSDLDAAAQAVRKALDTLSKRPEAELNSEQRGQLALAWWNQGVIDERSDRLEDAESAFDRSIKILKSGTAAEQGNVNQLAQLAQTYNSLAIVFRATARPEKAEEFYQLAITQNRALMEIRPTWYKDKEHLATNHYNLGNLHLSERRSDKALSSYRSAKDALDGLIENYPETLSFQEFLCRVQTGMGLALRSENELEQSAEAFLTAISLCEQIEEDFGARPFSTSTRATAYTNLSNLYKSQERWAEAKSALLNSVRLNGQLVADYPGEATYANSLAIAQMNLASLLLLDGSPEEAQELAEEAVESFAELRDGNPRNARYRRSAVSGYFLLVSITLELAEFDAAAAWIEKAAATDAGSVGAQVRCAEKYCECLQKVDESPELETEERETLKTTYVARAIQLLSAAVQLGWEPTTPLEEIESLEPLREDERFQALAEQLKDSPASRSQ